MVNSAIIASLREEAGIVNTTGKRISNMVTAVGFNTEAVHEVRKYQIAGLHWHMLDDYCSLLVL